MRIFTVSILVCFSCAQWLPPTEGTPINNDAEKAIQNTKLINYDWKVHEHNRFNKAGDESLAENRYLEALDYYDKALQFISNEYTANKKAETLLRLNRPQEALKTLEQCNFNRSKETWSLMVECCLQSKDYSKAFEICDAAKKSAYPRELSYVLRARVYKSMGDLSKAKDTLQEGLWQAIRVHGAKQDLIDELYALGAKPSLDPNESPDKSLHDR
ncbi:MAG: hypothetical protein P4L53_11340 [Candidatus Obscuribacterales bacterium]|nr:hypothetical protein [Candidatus Obscuribacterales bacterium]